jgi:multidrug efflux pump subunit AcrA (membrane-fusion protein)
MKALTWIKFVTPLALIAAIVFGLRSCAGNVTGDLTQIAEINSPQSQAAGNTARLMGEVQARAESDRQDILAAGQAQLELDRAKALQEQTLEQQAQAQQAEHAARLAEINAQEAAQLAAIDAKKAEQLAAIDTQRINTAAEWAIKIAGVIGLVAVAIIATLTLGRLARSFAVKRERAAAIPLMLNYDRHTLTLPAFVAIVDGRPMLVDPNVGASMALGEPTKADIARARYMAAQNSIAVQAINAPKDRITLPMLESEDRHD